jgi:hypothetical protein
MKKLFIVILISSLVLTLSVKKVSAATPASLKESLQQQVDDLKSKIASKVAELKLVEKRGIIGTVTVSSNTQLTLTDTKGNTRIVDVDEITKFSSSSKDLGISDIEKGDLIGVLGIYNKDSKRLLAREISILSPLPKVIFGGIKNIDSDNFEITVVKENGQSVLVSVEDLTRTFSYSSKTLAKSGFSKMTETEAIIVIGLPDKLDSKKIVASRIILLPDVDVTSRINLSASESDVIPSTGSGKKLTPITR